MDQLKGQASLSEVASATAVASKPGSESSEKLESDTGGVIAHPPAVGLPSAIPAAVPTAPVVAAPVVAAPVVTAPVVAAPIVPFATINHVAPSNVPGIPELAKPQDMPDRGGQHHPVAEFLYQLTKMLTDNNNEIIEWVEGRIKVHHPERLESDVLHKYFRHSKFASFQRQLNYFGFRKIAGKGKMSPCSYVNENATSDIRSLLLIKRKTNGSAARKAAMQQRAALGLQGGMNPSLGTGLPGLAGAAGMPGGVPGMPGGVPGMPGGYALNQLQMQQNPLSQLLAQNQQRQSWNDLQQLGGMKPNMPSIEQLQAQLASLSKQQQGGANAALNMAALNLATNGGAINLSQLQAAENPATATINATASAMPATAAMNAANTTGGQQNNLFESATNLKSLIGNDQIVGAGGDAQKIAHSGAQGIAQGQNLLNRLPSNGMFPGSVSNASLGNLLASSNRLSSLLSLNSFLSRDPSLADLAMMPNAVGAQQLAALQQQQQQQQQQQPHLQQQQQQNQQMFNQSTS
jgi:hypothetical protein